MNREIAAFIMWAQKAELPNRLEYKGAWGEGRTTRVHEAKSRQRRRPVEETAAQDTEQLGNCQRRMYDYWPVKGVAGLVWGLESSIVLARFSHCLLRTTPPDLFRSVLLNSRSS